MSPVHQEIERKYIVHSAPVTSADAAATRIRQGYLVVGEDGAEVRIRSRGDAFTLTVKRGSGLSRQETEIALTAEQFNVLWEQTEGRRVAKTRFEMVHGSHVIELDVFHEDLDGLVMAEVEFDSVESSRGFVPPEWFSDEVTGDPRFNNRCLARDGRP